MQKKLTAIDFFCGAGGFSEGFHQAGINIIMGVDNWDTAVVTHQVNHPNSNTIIENVEKIANLSDEEFESLIPDSDIIIGSPPCVAFSNSNKSGKADKEKGEKLIHSYLRIVARKKWKNNSILKYWILENVPNVEEYIKNEYSASELNLPGDQFLHVKNIHSGIYNAIDFGVPSKRKRYFCGEFPKPSCVSEPTIRLRDVLEKLGKPSEKKDLHIIDPVYNFNISGNEVTDHHYTQIIAQYQWKKAKQLKLDKGYMGKMSFPEDVNKPARTIMATLTFGARESFILDNYDGSYRAPTIREVASLMSFPIDYRFYGDSITKKYRLVGNAVPPKLAYAFAKAILEAEKNEVINVYNRKIFETKPEFYNLNNRIIPIAIEKHKNPKSRYKYHIPRLIFNRYRVELTNHNSDFRALKFDWCAEIHYSQGQKAARFSPQLLDSWIPLGLHNLVMTFIENNIQSDHNRFQEIYCLTSEKRKNLRLIGPDELLENIRNFLDSMPDEYFKNTLIFIEDIKEELPLIIVVGYYILKIIVNNNGGNEYEQRIKNSKTS